MTPRACTKRPAAVAAVTWSPDVVNGCQLVNIESPQNWDWKIYDRFLIFILGKNTVSQLGKVGCYTLRLWTQGSCRYVRKSFTWWFPPLLIHHPSLPQPQPCWHWPPLRRQQPVSNKNSKLYFDIIIGLLSAISDLDDVFIQLICACGTAVYVIRIYQRRNIKAGNYTHGTTSYRHLVREAALVPQQNARLYTYVWDHIDICCHYPTYISSTCNSLALLKGK